MRKGIVLSSVIKLPTMLSTREEADLEGTLRKVIVLGSVIKLPTMLSTQEKKLTLSFFFLVYAYMYQMVYEYITYHRINCVLLLKNKTSKPDKEKYDTTCMWTLKIMIQIN